MRNRILTCLALGATLLGLLAAAPTHAQGDALAVLDEVSHLCFDATRPDTLLLGVSTPGARLPVGSFGLNWATGERTSVATQPFDQCNPANGLLYGHAPGAPTSPASPALRWSASDPQPRAIARTPTHLASDGSLLAYSFDTALWASADGGRSWRQRRLPTAALFGMAVAPADGRALYLLAGSAPAQGGATPYTVFYSPDAGASWQRRSSGTFDNGNGIAPSLTIRTLEGASASVDSVLISTSGPVSGRYSTWTSYLSVDGGRTFRVVATEGAYAYGQLLQTSSALVRLSGLLDIGDVGLARSTDGGATWQPLALPGPVRRVPPVRPTLWQVPAAPDALLFADANDALWFSADGGLGWQAFGRASDVVAFTPYLPLSALLVADGQFVVRPLPDVGRLLTRPAAPLALPGGAFFPETGHNLGGIFKRTWERNGGLAQFGYPRSEPLREINPADGRVYLVQYFERNRFEYHPEFAGTPNELLLGLLGNQVTAERRVAGEAPFQPVANPNAATTTFFPQTGHTLAGTFRAYWSRNGAARIFGYPISEPFSEVNAANGQRYTVQYFERNRFEEHPELAGTPNAVLLGLLGDQVLRDKGWD